MLYIKIIGYELCVGVVVCVGELVFMEMDMKVNEWDILYEWKVVMLLVFGFGLVGFDCWFIVLLFFLIMKDLNLNV